MFSTRSKLLSAALALLGLVGCNSSSSRSPSAPAGHDGTHAAPLVTSDVYLQAQVVTIAANTFNNPTPITMWGYGLCTAGFATCATATVPGPAITANEGDTLNVHLRNNLTGPYVEATSVIIPGQLASMSPVWFSPDGGTATGARPPGDYSARVRSFTAETPTGNTVETVYTWTNLKAGTFLYQSGTHPAVQVQMGLYGALTVYPTTAGQAYDDPSSAFTTEATVLFSEIDPVIHNAVATGQYGPNPNAPNDPPPGWVTSTVNYRPQYFLINGKSFNPANPPIAGGAAGGKLLLRFLNAGLANKVPLLQGAYLDQIAEDGNFITITNAAGATVPAPRELYALLLPAGKTIDALVTATAAGNLPLYDRRLNLSNAGTEPGGMLTYVAFTGAAPLKAGASGPEAAR